MWLAAASSPSNSIPFSPHRPSATRSGCPPMARPIRGRSARASIARIAAWQAALILVRVGSTTPESCRLMGRAQAPGLLAGCAARLRWAASQRTPCPRTVIIRCSPLRCVYYCTKSAANFVLRGGGGLRSRMCESGLAGRWRARHEVACWPGLGCAPAMPARGVFIYLAWYWSFES